MAKRQATGLESSAMRPRVPMARGVAQRVASLSPDPERRRGVIGSLPQCRPASWGGQRAGLTGRLKARPVPTECPFWPSPSACRITRVRPPGRLACPSGCIGEPRIISIAWPVKRTPKEREPAMSDPRTVDCEIWARQNIRSMPATTKARLLEIRPKVGRVLSGIRLPPNNELFWPSPPWF